MVDHEARAASALRTERRRAWLRALSVMPLVPVAQAAWPWSRLAPMVLTPARAVEWRRFLGVNAQFQWFAPEVAQLQVERLQALGLNWVRLNVHWMILEPESGRYRFEPIDRMMSLVQGAGLHSITSVVGTPRFASSVAAGDRYEQYHDKFPPVDMGLLAQRMAMLARRYPNVDVWQVWNEPNLLGFWAPRPDPQAYYRMLVPSVQALRAAAPDKPVALAGMAYFSEMDGENTLMLEALGRLGVFQHDLIVAYHPYTAHAEGSEVQPRDLVQRVRHAHEWLRASGARQIWATEWGWSSYEAPRDEQPIVGELGQADETLRRLALMSALDYDRIFLFTLADLDERATRRDRSYGLLRRNGEPKPVYHALQRFLDICGAGLQPEPALALSLAAAPEGLVVIGWRRQDGRRLWMVWAAEAGLLRLPAVRSATVFQPLQGTQRALAGGEEGVQIPVQASLQLVVES